MYTVGPLETLMGNGNNKMYWHTSQQVSVGRGYEESTEDFIFQTPPETAIWGRRKGSVMRNI